MLSRIAVISSLLILVRLTAATAQPCAELDEFGGIKGVHRAATGFFRTTKADGRWWLVDPNGFVFISTGANRVRLESSRTTRGSDDYQDVALRIHGSKRAWAAAAVQSLQEWRFNTLGADSDRATWGQGMVFIVNLRLTEAVQSRETLSFPDIFDQNFERGVRRVALRTCKLLADEPWLLGYVTDNPLCWGSDEENLQTLLGRFLGLGDNTPGRRAILAFLKSRYLNVQELNLAWGTDYASFAEIGRTPQVGSHIPRHDVDGFQKLVAQEYFRIVHDAIRSADAHHLILGPRFKGIVPIPVLQAVGEYLDIISVDHYGASPPAAQLREIHRVTSLPVLISDFGFAVSDTRPIRREAYPSSSEADVAAKYQQYFTALIPLPMVVGCHWHSYVDEHEITASGEPVTKIGLVSRQNVIRKELVEGARELNEIVYELAAVSREPSRP